MLVNFVFISISISEYSFVIGIFFTTGIYLKNVLNLSWIPLNGLFGSGEFVMVEISQIIFFFLLDSELYANNTTFGSYINSLRPSDENRYWQPKTSLAWIMACCLFGTMQSYERIPEWHQLNPW